MWALGPSSPSPIRLPRYRKNPEASADIARAQGRPLMSLCHAFRARAKASRGSCISQHFAFAEFPGILILLLVAVSLQGFGVTVLHFFHCFRVFCHFGDTCTPPPNNSREKNAGALGRILRMQTTRRGPLLLGFLLLRPHRSASLVPRTLLAQV